MSPSISSGHIRNLIGSATVHALTALLAAVAVFIWCHGLRADPRQWGGLALIAGGVCLVAFIIGFALARQMLKPGRRFLMRVEKLVATAGGGSGDSRGNRSAVFDRAAHLLHQIDARQLFPDVICSSPRMKAALHQVRTAAPTTAGVLVCGENGTGKTLLAETIHRHGPRGDRPLERVDCTLRPAARLAAKLWGESGDGATDEAGAPAGAVARTRGGTLLLEEIAALPMPSQLRLFATIEAALRDKGEGNRSRWGAGALVATTSLDLGARVRAGQFHAGLYNRLELRIELPPLRERIEDMVPLAAHFLPGDPRARILEPSALQALVGYDWPGNVKELKRVIETAAARNAGNTIGRGDLPREILAAGGWRPVEADASGRPPNIDMQLQAIEKQMIEDALRQTGGIQVRAAERLGINQRSLWHRIKKYRIEAAAFKRGGPARA
ncbi:MAG: sigma 54-interacting transcriptional regulator [Desulfobacterales bacterium]|nr:sigma 54-interacting transcriptional regulator [Desulfobacterales bacterium]